MFEVKIAKGDTPETSAMRLYYNRMDFDKVERCPEDVGVRTSGSVRSASG